MRQEIQDFIKKKYGVTPEYLWRRFPDYAVFRHGDNNKWFALTASVPGTKLGLSSPDPVDVINLKIDDLFFRDILIKEAGIFPGYHMNKRSWVSVLLDGTVSKKRVGELLEMSFLATASAKKKEKYRPAKDWIVPANPKYYDVVRAFDEAEEIDWKQGAGIKKGDTVFLYVAAPVSAVLFRCVVTETDIPYRFKNEQLTIRSLMRIRLKRRYDPGLFTFARLKEEYGIRAVRGPRGIPHSLSAALKK